MVKECQYCNHDNEVSAAVCGECGGVFSIANEEADRPTLELTDIAAGTVIKIIKDGKIGRGGDFDRDFFAQNPYISEYHCGVCFKDGHYHIEHLNSAKNPTLLNQVKLTPGIAMIIRDNDSLKIATATFRVAIVNNNIIPPPQYFIICPVCKTEYEVADGNAKKDECHECHDMFDKKEIAKVGVIIRNAN